MSTNPEEAALIRSIVAHPDEDTPRLVYADWLDEHKQHERARLIRVQCSIVNLQAEEKALIEKHGAEWGGPLFGACCENWKFHRGFPEEVTMRFSDYFDTLERLNDLTPLCHLHLIGGTDDRLRQLAALPAAHQIRSLEIDRPYTEESPSSANDCGVEGIRALAESPYLGGLRSLRLHSHRLGEAGTDIVTGSPTFANLTHLALTDPDLRTNPAGTARMSRLIQSPHLSRLVELQYGDISLGAHALHRLRSVGPGPSGGRGQSQRGTVCLRLTRAGHTAFWHQILPMSFSQIERPLLEKSGESEREHDGATGKNLKKLSGRINRLHRDV